MGARSPAAGTAKRTASAVPTAPHRVLLLQRTLGNRGVARLVQSKRLTVRPGLGGTVQLKAAPEPAREQPEPATVSGPGPTGSPVQPAELQKEVQGVTAHAPDKSPIIAPGTTGAETGQAAEAAAVEPTAPAAPAAVAIPPATPDEDPAYQSVVQQLKTKAAREKTPHRTPQKKQAETLNAAKLSAQEASKQDAYSSHLGRLEETQPQDLTVDQFMGQFKALTTGLADSLPKSKDEQDSEPSVVGRGIASANVKVAVVRQANVHSGSLRTEAAKDAASYQQAREPEAKPELVADPAGTTPAIQQAGIAAPKPKADEQISLDDKSRSLDDALQNHSIGGQRVNIDEASLALPVSGEPSFDEAGAAKRKAQDEIRKTQPRYREEERKLIGQTQQDMRAVVNGGLQLQHGARKKSFDAVLEAQQKHKESLERKKNAVFKEIEGIYADTKTKVNGELVKLEGINDTFAGILTKAQDSFDGLVRNDLEYIYTPGVFDYSDWKDKHESEIKEEYEKRIRDRDGRPSAFLAADPAYLEALKTVRDRSAASLFRTARSIFVYDVNAQVEEKIAKPVVAALNAARKHVRDGKARVATAYAGLNPKEQEEARNVLDAVTGKFDQLDENVRDKQQEVIGDMARTYNQSLGKLEARFEEIKKDVLTSWFEKAWNKVKAVVNAIIEFATRILELLGRLAHLIGDIVSSPRAFFSNLVGGIGHGFSAFIEGIGQFLATAFFDWLRGSSGVTVQMPKDLGPQGIFSLFTQLLSLSKETVFERMEVVYGKVVANAFRRGEVLLDKGLEVFDLVKKEGLSGLWGEIKNSLGDILEETLEMIKENVLYAAIKKVILEVGKMLVPGGGFIAIAEKIVRLLKFIVEARDKILDLIESFVDSVEMAVKGNVGGIVKHITAALTKFITIALDFLVGVFGLGDLKDKVTRFIDRIRQPVIRGIDWVLNKFKPLVMKGRKLVEKGMAKVTAAGKAVVQVGVPKDPNERLRLAARASVAAARKLSGRVTRSLLNPVLGAIRLRYGLTSIQPYEKNGTWWITATINPKLDQSLDVPASTTAAGASPGSEWWKAHTHFNAKDGSSHTLFFKGESREGELMVESSPMPVFVFLAKVLDRINGEATKSLDVLREPHRVAFKLAQAVRKKMLELQHEDNPRQANEVAALNRNMNRLAYAIQPLIDVLFPDTKHPAGLVEGAYIRIYSRNDKIAVVKSFETYQGIPMFSYDTLTERSYSKTREGGASGPGTFRVAGLGQDFELTVLDARYVFLGANPSLDTFEGRQLFLKVAKKMQKQNKLRFADARESIHSVVILHGGGQYQLDQCHLSHIVDAQAWWNANGRVTAPRSSVVREFMNDPDNYELEPAGPNLSRGGALSGPETRYRPPVR
ncbi:hypothetical protein [Variovorax sp. J22R115]|uniref:hypothetical protein n=1 Tax=Variovorax sp. J22R115 TaxID=3053509 RepID=UPI002577D7AE|nr:hypothetical protein [Variovorax sp. J22R115]MDM0047943.1 hypothetical protein [Variovorax sp. J22R115]